MQSVVKKRVGIIRGGAGDHYASSLRRGGDIISHISENLSDKYKTCDILVDKDHIWHIHGLPVSPSDLMSKVDVVWNTSHPSFSNILQSLSIPHISSNPFSHTLEKSRAMLAEHMKKAGVNMPRHMMFPLYQADFDGPRERYSIKKAKEVHGKFGGPWIVKSLTDNSDMPVHLAKTFPELVDAIEDGVNHQTSILVEQFISGKVASVHSLANFRGEKVYTFPVVGIFGDLSSEEKEKLMTLAKDLHAHMGATQYLKLSFVLDKRGKVHLLHADSKIDPRKDSYLAQVCESVGAKMHHVVEHVLNNALS